MRGSRERLAAGKMYCQAHSYEALGYFLARVRRDDGLCRRTANAEGRSGKVRTERTHTVRAAGSGPGNQRTVDSYTRHPEYAGTRLRANLCVPISCGPI
jgi:hypothetical protein